MIRILFVSYYPSYRKRSLAEINKLASEIGGDYEIYVINNGGIFDEGDLKGDNSSWEFSAWDVGLKEIRELDSDLIIFCNDTFCQHRSWSNYDRKRFVRGFKKALKSTGDVVCGEINTYKKTFNILGCTSSKWISTYLFALRSGTVKKYLPSIALPSSVVDAQILAFKKTMRGEKTDFDNELAQHISEWLFPKVSGAGWYKSNATEELKMKKAAAILNEKYLSARLNSAGVKFIPTNFGILHRLWRKVLKFVGVI